MVYSLYFLSFSPFSQHKHTYTDKGESCTGRKTTHWAWWIFPTEAEGANEPGRPGETKTCVTTDTAPELVRRAHFAWRQCLEKIVSLASVAAANINRHIYEQSNFPDSIPLQEVLHAADIGRVGFFVKFWREQQCTPQWLRDVCDGLAKCMRQLGKLTDIERAKQRAGYTAVDNYVHSNMVVGLGTGSTAAYAVERVGQKLESGELTRIYCIPTSIATEKQARNLNIPLTTLDHYSQMHVAIDGADAVDPNTLSLIKGGGGALLREKMVEVGADQFICIVDSSKIHEEGLGPSFPLPVEITQWCHEHTMRTITKLPQLAGCTATLRQDKTRSPSSVFVTDNGNFIVDLKFTKPIENVSAAAQALNNMPGVVEHGLFINMASRCIVANDDGTIRTIER